MRGSEQVNKQKLAAVSHAGDSLFAMTSGLRSVRDKTLIYLDERLQAIQPYDRLYKIVNLFGDTLRQVRSEDGASLAASGHSFNTHAIIGGCLSGDATPQLFYVYPEGNWVEAASDSPYFMIGRTAYGKPILDRLLRYDSSIQTALQLALLAFDATCMSVTDVDCPIDVAITPNSTRCTTFTRLTHEEISVATDWWSQTLAVALSNMPMSWAEPLLQSLNTRGQT